MRNRVLAAVVCLALAGCGGDEAGNMEVRQVQGDTQTSMPKMSTKERLGLEAAHHPGDGHNHGDPHAGMDGMGSMGAMQGAAAGPLFAWTTPDGWSEQQPTSLRLINLKAGESVECYFTVLPGMGGGLLANVNRWRGQLGLDPVDEAALAALPKAMLMGQEALEVFMENDGQALAGLLAQAGGSALFVKMTGPEADVLAQTEAMKVFAASIQPLPPKALETNAEVIASHAAVEDTSGLAWTAPEGWVQDAPRPMRVVSYAVSGAECYIAVLGGVAGGVEANVNRWRRQMGQGPLSLDELNALQKLNVLGVEASMVQISGAFTGQSGESASAQMLLGAVCPWGAKTVFVKMVGPETAVAEQHDNFVAFCESLQPAAAE